jgi:hypothetical protein
VTLLPALLIVKFDVALVELIVIVLLILRGVVLIASVVPEELVVPL